MTTATCSETIAVPSPAPASRVEHAWSVPTPNRRGWRCWFSWAAARGIVAITELVVRLFPRPRRLGITKKRARPATIAVTGTFLADNWLSAHIRPLVLSTHCARVIVVSDEPRLDLPKVNYVHPPGWLRRLMGSAFARAMMLVYVACRERADVCGGFHLQCNGLAALVAARLLGARSLYFCVGGALEVLGGGAAAETRFFGTMGGADPAIERALVRLVDAMDQIVTMGTRARSFFFQRGVRVPIEVIPGGIDHQRFTPGNGYRPYDLILIARLATIKRIDLFLDVIHRVVRHLPHLKAVVVGDGDLLVELKDQTRRLGIEKNVDFVGYQADVPAWLNRAKIFVLTSDSEGLALSVMEAMMAGLPCIVSDVGDLGDLVVNSETGWLVPRRSTRGFADKIVEILSDPQRWIVMSTKARTKAMDVRVETMTATWGRILMREGFG